MPPGQGRKTTFRPLLTPEERVVLEVAQEPCYAWAVTPQLRKRARIILLLAQGQTITAIAQKVGLARNIIYKWIHRWEADRLQGLRDHKRGYPPGRRRMPKGQA